MLDNDAITIIVIGGVFAICAIAWNVRWAIEAYAERNKPEMRFGNDEIVDRIEVAICNATTDLLDALNEANATLDRIAESNQAILDDEGADEAPGTSIHEMFVDEVAPSMWVRPHRYGKSAEMNKWVDEWLNRYASQPPYAGTSDEPVDLTKHE